MARFDRGWIKFHRRVVEGDIGCSGVQLAVWVTLLCWSTRYETSIRWKGQQRVIPPGMVVTGIRELAARLGFSKDSIARALRALASRDSIRIETATRGTLISICKWDEYQCSDDESATQVRHSRDTDETRAGRQPDLNGKKRSKSKSSASAETTELWKHYAAGIRAKALEPVHDGAKTNTLCKRLVDSHGLDAAKCLVDAFLNDQEPFVRDNAWSIGLLASQQQKYLAKSKYVRPVTVFDFGSDDASVVRPL